MSVPLVFGDKLSKSFTLDVSNGLFRMLSSQLFASMFNINDFPTVCIGVVIGITLIKFKWKFYLLANDSDNNEAGVLS